VEVILITNHIMVPVVARLITQWREQNYTGVVLEVSFVTEDEDVGVED